MNKIFIKSFLIGLLAALLVSVSCSSSESVDDEDTAESNNIIKNYVNEPKSKAINTKNKLEANQNAVQQQADMLGEE